MITDAQVAAAQAAHAAEQKLWVVRMMPDAWGYRAFREDIAIYEVRCGTDRVKPTVDEARREVWEHIDEECWRKALEAVFETGDLRVTVSVHPERER